MNLLFSLSWKNIWRSHKRSFVVIGSIAVGVWALTFLFGFLNSFNEGYIRNAIQYDYSHIQIHHPEYRIDPNLDYFIEESDAISSALKSMPEVGAFSQRAIVNGMIATGRSSQGVRIFGIDPEQENKVTSLGQLLVSGNYFTAKRNPVLISQKLAEKLNVKEKSKVVVTLQDANGNITSAAFRVDGIFVSKSPRINEGVIYVRRADIQRLTLQEREHEIAILLRENEHLSRVKQNLEVQFPDSEVLAYNELAPEFDLIRQQSEISKQILTGIIMLALLFGIVNTMLMSVLERTRELGMLRAVGMHKSSVFYMILLETIFLSLVGGPAGLLLGFLTNTWFGVRGMDLSAYAKSLEQLGFDAVFYPELDPVQYPILMVVVMVTALLGAIYPAIKAIKLNPVESIRKI